MSRWFTVPITVNVEVMVPDTGDTDRDRAVAAQTAETLGRKRIQECTWGMGNPWTARVHDIEVGYPSADVEDEEDTDE